MYFYPYLLNDKIVTALLLWVISVLLPSGKVTLLLPLGLKAFIINLHIIYFVTDHR